MCTTPGCQSAHRQLAISNLVHGLACLVCVELRPKEGIRYLRLAIGQRCLYNVRSGTWQNLSQALPNFSPTLRAHSKAFAQRDQRKLWLGGRTKETVACNNDSPLHAICSYHCKYSVLAPDSACALLRPERIAIVVFISSFISYITKH